MGSTSPGSSSISQTRTWSFSKTTRVPLGPYFSFTEQHYYGAGPGGCTAGRLLPMILMYWLRGGVAVVFEGIELWLHGQMARRGIKGARRLAFEADLDLEHVSDWLIGRGSPDEVELRRLARFFGQDPAEAWEAITRPPRRRVA